MGRNLPRGAYHKQKTNLYPPEMALLSHSTLYPQNLNVIQMAKEKYFQILDPCSWGRKMCEFGANSTLASTVLYSGPILSTPIFSVDTV